MTEPEVLLDSPIEIVEQLKASPLNKLPVDAIRAAQRQGEAMVPHLVEVLQQAIDEKKAGRDPEDSAYLYALFLLTEMKREELREPLLELLTLPEDGTHELIGDCVTEDLPRILAQLFDADDSTQSRIMRDPSLDQFVRWSTAGTYVFLVRNCKLTREEAVARLEGHLRWAIENRDADLALAAACQVDDFAMPTSLALLEQAYAENLIDLSFMTFDDQKETIARGDDRFNDVIGRLSPTGIEDTVTHLEGWYTYREEDSQLSESYEEYAYDNWEDDEEYAFDDDYLPSDTIRNDSPRVGRNEPCPCQSGKKYKKCCGKPL